MKFFTAVVAIVALASSASAALSTCGSASDDFQLTGLTYTPNPPKVNQKVCVKVKGKLAKAVTAGAKIKVTATVCKSSGRRRCSFARSGAPCMSCVD